MGIMLFEGMFFLVFFLILFLFLGLLIFNIGKEIVQWSKNNRSPRLTVEAAVVAKRSEMRRHHDAHGAGSHTRTKYYVTFQLAGGDRMELGLSGQEYGVLVEGDRGRLTFQGTRYLGFERI